MDALRQDFVYAFRAFARRPGFVLVVLLIGSLGIGANVAIFSVLDQVLFKPFSVRQGDRLVRVYTSNSSGSLFGRSSYPDLQDLRQDVESLDALVAYTGASRVVVERDGELHRFVPRLVEGELFPLLGIEPATGRLLGPTDDEELGAHPVVVLSHEVWEREFGADPEVVGQTLRINAMPFTVVGVAPRAFRDLQLGVTPDMFFPLSMYREVFPAVADRDFYHARGSRWLELVGRLAPNASVEQAEAELNVIMQGLAAQYPDTNLGTSQEPDRARPVTVRPLREVASGAEDLGETRRRAGLLALVMSLVLVLACANIANLLLVRTRERRREMAVRAALGAEPRRLVGQNLVESVLLALLAGIGGLGVALLFGRFLIPLGLPTILQSSLELPGVVLDVRAMLFALLVSLATGLAFGLLPALEATRLRLVPALRQGSGGSGEGRDSRAREGLVVLQVAGSLVLLITTGIFFHSLLDAYRVDLGFEPRGVLVASMDAAMQKLEPETELALYRQVLERADSLPGVDSAALGWVIPVNPLGGSRRMYVEGHGARAEDRVDLDINFVSGGYFRTLRIPLLQGRVFEPRDRAGAPMVAIVNRALADTYWPGENPIGRRIRSGCDECPWMEVVGVVETTKYLEVREDPRPYVYLPLSQNPRTYVTLVLRSSRAPEDLVAALRAQVREVSPVLPLYDVQTLEDQLAQVLAPTHTAASLIGVLGLLSLILAAVGIYGVMAHAVTRKTREIGIRRALGAEGGHLLGTVLYGGLRATLVGIGLGTLVALVVGRWLKASLEDVQFVAPTTFVGVAVALLVIALLASWVPARRAVRIAPVEALRHE